MPAERIIRVQRTARYYTLGTWSEATTCLWIVCHGYAQLAGDFIKQFEVLADDHTAIAAPEALSRFYPKAGDPRVGATWMTREDREHEIKDYVDYLNQLYHQLVNELPSLHQVNILGFSQGCATVSRWVASGKSPFNDLWLCAGDVPPDLDYKAFNTALTGNRLHVLIGTEDHFITPTKVEEVKQRLEKEHVAYQMHTFAGAHVINLELLKELAGIHSAKS